MLHDPMLAARPFAAKDMHRIIFRVNPFFRWLRTRIRSLNFACELNPFSS
jgi:hypothetical protein